MKSSGSAEMDQGEQRGKCFLRHRSTEEIALRLIASQLEQQRPLGLLLDPFREHQETEAVGHGDDRSYNWGWTGLCHNFLDKRLIDLYHVDRQPLQIAERRIAGPKVVDG